MDGHDHGRRRGKPERLTHLQVVVAAPPALVLAPLDAAVAGEAFAATLGARGGVRPYRCSIFGGAVAGAWGSRSGFAIRAAAGDAPRRSCRSWSCCSARAPCGAG